MINLEKVTYRYNKNQKLIEGIDLNLELGKIYGLFGKNGAGKTTLLKLIAGLLYPQSGVCGIDGIAVSDRKPETLSKLFVVPEEFELPAITAKKFVEINSVFYSKFNLNLIIQYLKEFEISADDRLDKISMGQKKKFMLAFGLAVNTEILILDEPTNGLDIPSKSIFRKMLAANIDDNRMVIISTHQVRDLAQSIDHILILEQGDMLLSHSVQAITDKLAFEQVKSADAHRVLYSEPQLGAFAAVCTRNGCDTDIDFELLFNAVLSNHSTITNALNN